MQHPGFVVVTDRGGHLHNARMLMDQMELLPEYLVTTLGPDIDSLREKKTLGETQIVTLPRIETWLGTFRFWNPFRFVLHVIWAFRLVLQIRPKKVISLGAANVVPFCYLARLFGARIYHVECMNQIFSRSITGRLLYPITTEIYVQWKELLNRYGGKARYEGWVL